MTIIYLQGAGFMPTTSTRDATNAEKIKKYAMLIAEKDNPNWNRDDIIRASEEKQYIDKAIDVLTLSDFRQRIYVEYQERVDYEECAAEAKYLLDNMPQELIPNLNEWLDDQPLSDIKVHGVSINDVMKMFETSLPRGFLQILKCMTTWKKYNYVDKNFCWNYFALM